MKDDNDEHEFMYQISWSQEYPDLQDMIDREMNLILEQSGYKEANEVINRIKKGL